MIYTQPPREEGAGCVCGRAEAASQSLCCSKKLELLHDPAPRGGWLSPRGHRRHPHFDPTNGQRTVVPASDSAVAGRGILFPKNTVPPTPQWRAKPQDAPLGPGPAAARGVGRRGWHGVSGRVVGRGSVGPARGSLWPLLSPPPPGFDLAPRGQA